MVSMRDVSGVQLDAAAPKFMENWKNKNEYEYVMLFKDIFVRDNFPNDFDAWTIKKQYNWINQNIAQFFPNTPQSLHNLIPASFYPLNNYDRSPEKLPEWMDINKYRKGQKFVQTHYAGVILSAIIGIMYVYSFDEQLKPLILGANSHTLYLAFKRYLTVIKRVSNWYDGDPWVKGTEAYKDMQVAHRMHFAIRKKECQMDHEQLAAACTFANPWCPDRELLLKDFAMACPPEKFGQRPYIVIQRSAYKPRNINNMSFAVTQTLFMGPPLFCPEKVGIHNATDEDLEAFSHMWKCYGYFLGIEDEYNFCRGNLDEIKQRVRDLYQYWILQNFKELTPESEHVTRCIAESFNYYPFIYMPYKVYILLATDVLNLNMPHLYKSLNYTEWIVYKIYKFLLYSVKIPFIRTIGNKIIRKIIDKAVNFNAEKLAEIHEKSKKILPDFSIIY